MQEMQTEYVRKQEKHKERVLSIFEKQVVVLNIIWNTKSKETLLVKLLLNIWSRRVDD